MNYDILKKYSTQWIKKSFQKPRAYINQFLSFGCICFVHRTLGNPDSRCLSNFWIKSEWSWSWLLFQPAGWHLKCPSANQINHSMHTKTDRWFAWLERKADPFNCFVQMFLRKYKNCKIVLGQHAMTILWDAMILNKIKLGKVWEPLLCISNSTRTILMKLTYSIQWHVYYRAICWKIIILQPSYSHHDIELETKTIMSRQPSRGLPKTARVGATKLHWLVNPKAEMDEWYLVGHSGVCCWTFFSFFVLWNWGGGCGSGGFCGLWVCCSFFFRPLEGLQSYSRKKPTKNLDGLMPLEETKYIIFHFSGRIMRLLLQCLIEML